MTINKIDLGFYLEPPDLSVKAEMSIFALAPLSMVSSQPGSYYRSELSPTSSMLYGMLENALGWHFFDSVKDKFRNVLLKDLTKRAKKIHGKKEDYKDHPWLESKKTESGSGFKSLLQHHIKFEIKEFPEVLTYDDLWSTSFRTESDSFIGGSRNYDSNLENLINLSKTEDPSKPANNKGIHPSYISFGDRKEHQTFTLEELLKLTEGKIKTKSIKPHFPMYYSSPKKRGYVIPKAPYIFSISCTQTVCDLLEKAINEPYAPLYLGSNDGWVDVKWKRNG